MKILILTEAGEGIGFGHYTRCQAIQQEMLAKQIQAEMLLNVKGDQHFEVIGSINNWLEKPTILSSKTDVDLVLIDSYLAENSFFKDHLSHNFKRVAVLDDYMRLEYDVDLVVNPNVYFNPSDYSARSVGGKDFVILREPFRDNLNTSPLRETVQHILISLGGSDFRKLLPKIVRWATSTQACVVTVIDPENTMNKIKNERVCILGTQNAEEMLSHYQKADIVVSACGQTLHELASLGKATIGICLDIDQEKNQQYYYENQFLSTQLKWDMPNLLSSISASFEKTAILEKRQAIQFIGPKLINKKGVTNLVNSLIDLSW
jgi:spore coat polysaccharide biosynthesis predicted glycosyltransferase SpsG